jgi:hypothetical protein
MFAQKPIITIGFLACSLTMQAQDSLLLRDYQFVKREDPWLTSPNAAALTRFQHPSIAEAELSTTLQHGGFTNFNTPSDALQADASIESYYRISRRTVLYGRMSYESLTGKDMAGSAFIPNFPHSALRSSLADHRPFDIVEDSLSNSGEKHLDAYLLTGSIGCELTDFLAVGARLDYTAANYTKYKDLRHQNKLMDLKAVASLYAKPTSWSSVGACYQYRRNIESVRFGTFGTTDKVYKSLIDYGVFFGKVEQFGTIGYTDKSREMPLVDEQHSGAMQAEVRPVAWLSAYCSIATGHREGYYGRKSPYTITYTSHSGDQTSLTARLTLSSRMSTHSIDLAYSTEQLQNKAETYRELQNASGASYYEYFEPVETADKKWQEGRIAYTGDLLVREAMPAWTVVAGMSWMKRVQTASLYPYFRYQKLSSQAFFAGVTRNLVQHHGVWSLTLGASYQKGSGQPFADGTFTTPSEKQDPPPTMETWLYREHQYLTSPQYSVCCQAKYAFMMPGTKLKAHVRLGISHLKATKTNSFSCGDNHSMAVAAIGCTF